jgi:hypothetical protein
MFFKVHPRRKYAGGFGALSPIGAALAFGGRRFTRNGFGDNRDDLSTCQRPMFNQRRRDCSNAGAVLGDQARGFRTTEIQVQLDGLAGGADEALAADAAGSETRTAKAQAVL